MRTPCQRLESANEEVAEPSRNRVRIKTDQSLINFADHITTVVEIDQLRSISEALFESGLSQGWPLSEQPGFATAGIRLGNLNLELCTVDQNLNKLHGWLTFEPKKIDALADQLAERKIKHDPFDAVVIHGKPIYTRIGLPELEQDSTALQLCHLYYPTRLTGPVAPENKAGIRQVKEIRIGMSDHLQNVWNKLLTTEEIGDIIHFKEGPELLISSAQGLKIDGITIETEDPIKAIENLTKAGMTRIKDQTLRVGSLEITIG